jgi:ribosomal protein S21
MAGVQVWQTEPIEVAIRRLQPPTNAGILPERRKEHFEKPDGRRRKHLAAKKRILRRVARAGV